MLDQLIGETSTASIPKKGSKAKAFIPTKTIWHTEKKKETVITGSTPEVTDNNKDSEKVEEEVREVAEEIGRNHKLLEDVVQEDG